jgi:hypothetical protein
VISNANGDMTLLDDVDERMVEELHKLGKVSVTTWAEDREKTTEQEARCNQDLHFARKKNLVPHAGRRRDSVRRNAVPGRQQPRLPFLRRREDRSARMHDAVAAHGRRPVRRHDVCRVAEEDAGTPP